MVRRKAAKISKAKPELRIISRFLRLRMRTMSRIAYLHVSFSSLEQNIRELVEIEGTYRSSHAFIVFYCATERNSALL